MITSDNKMHRSILKSLVGLAGAAGIASTASLAQDCKLSVHAAPQVLYTGQSAGVNVFAHFPTPPALNAPYAFAAASFDVLATDPTWSFATDGAIVGNDVLGIEIGQAHLPQQGIFADPSNPLRVWRGIFKPQSPDPALVEIEVDPMAFSVYPSELTSSAAGCDVAGGSDYIFVNPLSVGRWLAAPGRGTTLEVLGGDGGDVLIGGLTGYEDDTIRIGMILPAIYHDRTTATSARVEFDGEPATFTATVQALENGKAILITTMKLEHEGFETGGYAVGMNFSFVDGSVRGVRYDAYLGGVWVASGDLDNDGGDEMPGLVVSSLPQTIGSRVNTGALPNGAGTNTYGGLTTISEGLTTLLTYDTPIVATVRGIDGLQQAVTLDRIEVHGIQEAAARNTSSDYPWQVSLGAHVFEATGVRRVKVYMCPSQ